MQDCNGNLGEPPYAKVTITFEPDPTVTWSNPDSYKTAFRTILKVPGAGSNLGLFVNDKPPADCSSGGLAQSFRLDRLVGGTFLDYQEVGGDFIGDMWEVDATRQGNNSATAGKVVAYQDGSFLFVPAKDFVGMATFQYTVMVRIMQTRRYLPSVHHSCEQMPQPSMHTRKRIMCE
jgi:hypothetical protein